jgi:hypothetical protein
MILHRYYEFTEDERAVLGRSAHLIRMVGEDEAKLINSALQEAMTKERVKALYYAIRIAIANQRKHIETVNVTGPDATGSAPNHLVGAYEANVELLYEAQGVIMEEMAVLS